MFKVSNFVVQCQCVQYVLSALQGNVLNGFQKVLAIVIEKTRFIIYLFAFVVAILGLITHLKMYQSSLLISTKYNVGGTCVEDVTGPMLLRRALHRVTSAALRLQNILFLFGAVNIICLSSY